MKNEDKALLIPILERIKVVLYVIVVLLFILVVLNIVNVNNTISLYSTSSSWGENGDTDSGNDSNEEELEYDEFNEIDYSEFEKIMDKEEGTHVVYIGRSTCYYCALFVPIMIEAQEKYGFTTDYFDISTVYNYDTNTVINKDAYDKLSDYNDFFEENFLSTPMVVIFKDGKYVDGSIGYQEISGYSSFLEKNGFEAK